MTTDLKGKHSLIIGGTSNLGVAIAKNLLEAGAEVTLAGRNKSKLLKCSKEISTELPLLSLDLQSKSQVNETLSNLTNLPDILIRAQGGNLGVHQVTAKPKIGSKSFNLISFRLFKSTGFCWKGIAQPIEQLPFSYFHPQVQLTG